MGNVQPILQEKGWNSLLNLFIKLTIKLTIKLSDLDKEIAKEESVVGDSP